MPDETFRHSTLLLVAHGSTMNSDSAVAAKGHAAALRSRGLFAEVAVAFWKQPPFIRDVAAAIRSPRVYVVPLFLSDGFFTQQIIPSEIGFPRHSGGTPQRCNSRAGALWHYCPPFGTHPRMVEVVCSRAIEAIGSNAVPLSRAALFLAAHGTGRNSESRKAAEWQVDRIRELARFAQAQAVFMEEEPRISDCRQLTSLENMIVVPFFISDGMHAREDIPVLLGEDPALVQERLHSGCPTWVNPTWRGGKCIWYSRSVGTAPLVAELILERVREAAGL